jgi:hypothetical protein
MQFGLFLLEKGREYPANVRTRRDERRGSNGADLGEVLVSAGHACLLAWLCLE